MGKVDENEGTAGLTPGTLIDGRYKVVRFIGQGGNGLVHEVEHVLTGRRLALKSLHDDTSYGRLEQEARATSIMKNGHAVKVTDMGINPGAGPYIVMDLLEGQSLRSLLDDTGQLPLELTINIALQVCECLAEAHQHGIIHRDLKPDNVFLCPGPTAGSYDVKVLDFGVVKIAQDGPIPNSSLTRTGSTVGTPFYMSLEQLRNSSAVDQRADIYALGVVLYESLSGRKPFQAETIGDLVYALCSGPPTHLSRLRPDLPPAACDVIMRALSSTRDQRHATMAELAQDLLPFGDASLGTWLKTSGPRGSQPSTPAPPAASSQTPSGVKRGHEAPSAPRPAAGGSAGASPPRPGVPRPDSAGAAAWPARPATAAARERPQAAEGGDRDTPTEMYIKGRHGVEAPGTASALGAKDAPGMVVPPRGDAPPVPARRERPQLDSRPGDRDTPTRAMEAVHLNRPEAMGGQGAGEFRVTHTQPIVGNVTPSTPGFNPPAEPRTPFPAFMAPSSPPPNVAAPGGGAAATGNVAMPSFRPAWQEKLDRALTAVGGWLESTARMLSLRFRAASPRVQIIIVVTAASLFAALVVLTFWLITA
jgi:serine/threonine-protein kinase